MPLRYLRPQSARSSTPTTPMIGVGKIAFPSVSLYKLTLPPVIGTFRARHASAIPSTAVGPFKHTHDANDWRGKNRLPVSFIVQTNVAAGDRNVQGTACLCDTFDRSRPVQAHPRRQ